MWTRAELKERGKISFERNYWKCVLVSLILMLFTGGISASIGIPGFSNNPVSDFVDEVDSDNDYDMEDWEDDYFRDSDDYLEDEDDYFDDSDDYSSHNHHIRAYGHSARGSRQNFSWSLFLGIFSLIFGLVALIILALNILVFQPLEIGGCRFYIENAYGATGVDRLLFAFRNGQYGKNVLTMFLRSLFTFLWSLLLVIPGIVKAYEYRMIPYLLADCPEMSREDAFYISKQMMDGQKWNAFVLDLSFIGWNLLAGMTCGLVGIFYSFSYQYATNAELFLTLREQYFRRQDFGPQDFHSQHFGPQNFGPQHFGPQDFGSQTSQRRY